MNYVKNIWTNSSARIMLLLFVALLFIVGFFLVYGYYTQLSLHQEKILTQNEAIARSTAVSLRDFGDMHGQLMSMFSEKDAISDNDDYPFYRQIHDYLAKIAEDNHIESDIYTLVKDPDGMRFLFGVTSGVNPYFRHEYVRFPPELVEHYQMGGKLMPYQSENGNWLSAFAPITNSKGEVVAVVHVDQNYDEFLARSNRAILLNSLITLAIVVIIALVLARAIRTILLREEELKRQIRDSHAQIEQKNKDITDSIYYAKRIQEAIAPSVHTVRESLPDCFVMHLPRDIVSGDFYWFTEVDGMIIIAAVDCTGHGVPGAFMSMIGTILLNNIVDKDGILEPGKILDELDQRLRNSLKVEGEDRPADGMDVALCCFDTKTQHLEFAGALRPLVYVRGEEVIVEKGGRYPIGGDYPDKPNFTTYKCELQPGDRVYLFSDGFIDQFGGPKNKKFLLKRFKSCLIEFRHTPIRDMQAQMQQALRDWQMDQEQVDDILLIGFCV